MTAYDPDRETAVARVAAGETVLVTARRIDDLETPVSAYLKLAQPGRTAFLLESVEGGAWRGRYSAIGLDPDLVWRCRGGRAEIARAQTATDVPDAFEAQTAAPLDSLRAVVAETAIENADAPPMAAGLFGYLGYDMIREVERLPSDAAPDPLDTPDALLVRPRVMVIFDALSQEILAAAPARSTSGDSPAAAVDAARERIEAVFAALDAPSPQRKELTRTEAPEPSPNMAESTYRDAVERAKAYIRAGDIFQVVPSQRFTAPFPAPAFSLYRSLRRSNPSPFLYFFDFEDFSIVGSSPEILVRVRDDVVTVRPIAGTRPRGATPEQDAAYEAELKADPKERAEHLMLLDLGRNDVGRVAKAGSVRVTEREGVERYSHVMHLVSNVEGELAEGEDAVSALFAGFPPGTVSGAPKVRAMEIIDELEPHRRGIYAGAIGYFGADGGLDTCIALRTTVIKDGAMHVQAGAGVVLDSDPEAERVETVNKAQALFRAAAEAWRFG
ncbi:anthranilate synthase component I [Marinicauda salina]|uniref:Anthranilate synthase component 1 n=1 Tax=Marinicauda salina TaxID=2135793 RepID=A0A2U2BTA1_9PROT|nr:anthranilate synthase component I [Marinicauda salina]PWE17227.1 anthranilate synthase component I [Marinicauda salina]